jgi:tetratricopeptide (TPR) repeat protein
MIFISAAILSVTLIASPQAPDQRAEAERMANSGANAAALRQFQAIAAANPDDLEARLWIARLHARMGHPEAAIDVYRSIVAAQPQHVDALVGLGQSLVTIGNLKDAADALNRAEALAADRPAVLAAQGRLHDAANHNTLALAYYNRAIAIEPTNAEARRDLDALRAERAHRLEVDYDYRHLNVDVEDAHVGTMEVNARVGDTLRLFGRGQVQTAFGVDEQRGGGGLEWNVTRRAMIRVGGLFGGNTFLPDSDVFVDASITRGRARWMGQIRAAKYEGADLWIGGPGLAITFPGGTEASFRYYRGKFTASGFGSEFTTDTIALRLQGRVSRRLRASAGYTHGIDRLDWLTVDRVTTEADTLLLKTAFDYTPFTTFEVGYAFESRPAGVQAHRAQAGLTYRF